MLPYAGLTRGWRPLNACETRADHRDGVVSRNDVLVSLEIGTEEVDEKSNGRTSHGSASMSGVSLAGGSMRRMATSPALCRRWRVDVLANGNQNAGGTRTAAGIGC